MLDAPATIDDKQLEELYLEITTKGKILHLLIENPMQTVSNIAYTVNLSEEQVSSELGELQKEGNVNSFSTGSSILFHFVPLK